MKSQGYKNRIQNFTQSCLKRQRKTLHQLNELQTLLIQLPFEGKLSMQQSLKKVRSALIKFNRCCPDLEEKILFPFVEIHLPKLETLRYLYRSEQRDIERNIENLMGHLNQFSDPGLIQSRASLLQEIQETGIYLICLIRTHLQAETSLYNAIDRCLRSEEKAELWNQVDRFVKQDGHGGGRICK